MNKFLLFVFISLIFLGYSQVSSAATISATTNAATAISTTTVTLNGTITTTVASETYNRRGFNLGTAQASGGSYNLGSSTDAQSFVGPGTPGDTSFYHTTTTISGTTPLEPGTLYYFRAYGASSTDPAPVKYGGQLTFLTKPVEPATSTFSVASLEDRIKITWTAGTGAGKTMIRYNDGTTYPTLISDGTQAYWGSGTEVTLYNLPSEHTYYFRAWSSTTNEGLTQQSDSYASISSKTTAVSLGGASRVAPTTYSDSLVINEGAATTQTREVTLTLKAENASLMTICNRSDLLNCPLENYTVSKSWTLIEGDGVKTAYAKFLSPDGLNSDTVSDTITLKTPVVEKEAPTPTPTTPTEEVPVPASPAPAPATPAPVAKPISEMTVEELKVKIAEIVAQVAALQAQLTEIKEVTIEGCTIASFDRNLQQGMSGDDVKCLQIVLNSASDTQIAASGVGSSGQETNYFGSLTKAAVIKFQEKYASEVLATWGLTKGTGFIGSTTRDKLNELLGK